MPGRSPRLLGSKVILFMVIPLGGEASILQHPFWIAGEMAGEAPGFCKSGAAAKALACGVVGQSRHCRSLQVRLAQPSPPQRNAKVLLGKGKGKGKCLFKN